MKKQKVLCRTCVHLTNHDANSGPIAENGTVISIGEICTKLSWYMSGEGLMAVECQYYVDKNKEPEAKEVIDVIGITDRITALEESLNDPAVTLPEKIHFAFETVGKELDEIRKLDRPKGESKVFNIENATIN